MRINVTADFSDKDYKEIIRNAINQITSVILNELKLSGLGIVRDARSKIPHKDYHLVAGDARTAARLVGGSINLSSAAGFNDDTGNLRSSIGYIIMYDGQIVSQHFQVSDSGSDKTTGIETGKSYAEKLAKDNPLGWILIVVAGMEYASWVEALGYDVITGSTLGAGKKLQDALSRALDSLNFK